MARQAERGGPAVHPHERNDDAPRSVQLDAPLRQLLAQGRPSPADVATLLRRYPMQQIAMMETIHRELGNAFASEVDVELRSQNPHGAAMSMTSPRVGPGPTPAVLASGTVAQATTYANVAEQQLATLEGTRPGYVRARSALDQGAVHLLGMAQLTALELLRAALRGLDEQLATHDGLSKSAPAAEPTADLAQTQQLSQLDMLRQRREQLVVHANAAQLDTLLAMVPREYRGVPLADIPAPIATLDRDGRPDVRAQVNEELARTLTVIHAAERLFMQFAKPGALQDGAQRFTARYEIAQFAHRPADLAFLRAALMGGGLWQELNTADGPGSLPGLPTRDDDGKDLLGVGVCKDDGPLSGLYAETKKQAAEMGWLTDVGNYDRQLAEIDIRIGGAEALGGVYQRIMSASADGRAQILYSLQRRGLLDSFLKPLPWRYTKDIHDGLPGGHGEIKSVLQQHFLVDGRWGKDLGAQEYHAPSLTKLLRDAGDSVGGIGEDLIDGSTPH